MRFALWSVILAAVAVGVALFARSSTGYVVIIAAPYRIELSLNLLIFLVLMGYVAFYALARLVTSLLAIPGRVRAYRADRVRSRLRVALNDALLAFFQGRYASAERSAAAALTGDETKGVAAIIAARSAHELGRFSEREQFLEQAKGAAPEVDQARLTTLADLLVSQERYDEALAVLNDLSARDARNLRLLRLKLQAEQATRNWDEVLATLAALAKLGGIGPAEAAGIRRAAHLGNLNRKSQDAAALTEYWKQLPAETRVDPAVAASAARYHLALGSYWGKAQSYIEASLALEPTHDGHMTLAALMEQLGKHQEAVQHFRRSAELAG